MPEKFKVLVEFEYLPRGETEEPASFTTNTKMFLYGYARAVLMNTTYVKGLANFGLKATNVERVEE